MARDIDDKPMSIGEHLEELRKRLWLAVVGILPIFCVGLYFGNDILNFIVLPLEHALKEKGVYGAAMQTTSVLEGFATYLKIAMVLAIVVGGPWIIYQTWKFVAPGLYVRERRFFYILSPMSAIFSALGLAFMYYFMLPAVLGFFVHFNDTLLTRPSTPIVEASPGMVFPGLPWIAGDLKDPRPGQMWINTQLGAVRVVLPNPEPAKPGDNARLPPRVMSLPLQTDSFIVQQYKIAEYVGLVLTFAFAFALTFQTPVVVVLLGWVGIIDPKTIGRHRKWALLICTAVAAVVTPPDFWSMISLMVPMYLLFELGIILLRIMPARRVASGKFFSRGTETRDGEGPSGDDPSARPDNR